MAELELEDEFEDVNTCDELYDWKFENDTFLFLERAKTAFDIELDFLRPILCLVGDGPV